MSDVLYAVIPAYNEEENIKNVVEDWYPVIEKCGPDCRLVIIDDGSKDNTYSLLKECAESRPQMIALTKENSGHGATVLYGYRYAIEHGADYVFQTDSDGQTLPLEFLPFWTSREKYDIIIGYRNKREDGFSRVFVTRVLRLVVKMCFGVFVLDANTPFRMMKADVLKGNMTFVPEDFFLSNVALSAIYKKRGQKMHFIPITFRPRQGGVNSINLKRIFKIGLQSLKDFREINDKLL